MVGDGDDIVVGNTSPELALVNTTTGVLVRRVTGSAYKLDGAGAMVSSGPDLYIADSLGNALTEVDA